MVYIFGDTAPLITQRVPYMKVRTEKHANSLNLQPKRQNSWLLKFYYHSKWT